MTEPLLIQNPEIPNYDFLRVICDMKISELSERMKNGKLDINY